ncbi:MAG: N-acetyl-gamma-glutamyl-phosphate reductase [Acidobacteriota bacterium]
MEPIAVAVLGGSGYVAGELVRLLAGHPVFRLVVISSESKGGQRLEDNFFHLRGTAAGRIVFGELEAVAEAVAAHRRLAVFSALPHGEAAARIDEVLTVAERAGTDVRVVDLSGDFRHGDAASYGAIYGKPHGAPRRIAEFLCALPDLEPAGELGGARHVAHPGCFTTAATLALAPLAAEGWLDPSVPATVVAVTGSTGAGRTPTATTHHPERRSDLFAYNPLGHRHEPEMRALVARAVRSAAGTSADGTPDGGRSAHGELASALPDIAFVPHSGPFARGIHATITAKLARPATAETLRASIAAYYARIAATLPPSSSSSSSFPSTEGLSSSPLSPSSTEEPLPLSSTEELLPFVQVLAAPPRLQAVVGTNRCDLAVAVRGDHLIAFSAIDNLVKGAAGGGVQWMNRLFDLPAATGLVAPGLGWL